MKPRRQRCPTCAPSSRRLVPRGQDKCARCARNWNQIRNIRRRIGSKLVELSGGMGWSEGVVDDVIRRLYPGVMAWSGDREMEPLG